ncbi:MFS transporter [Streptomyces sp. SID8379]|uniref:MFS transporter n=1 Tax=unclassified Streptomyces TaxID=2593676 RepID=UPI000361085E|nr:MULTISPECIES: MFS transporter [unclassified Streptomyces]MYW65222.1 MFS transporter [Streptomyces sp. SID8379]
MRARWAGVLSLLVVVLISYVDRVNVSVLITDEAFTDHFGITGDRVAQGALSTVFLVGYGIAAFFLTPLYETRLGVRRGLFVSVALWSVMTLLSPYALGALTLTMLRALLGAAEGPLFSLKTMYVREHFAPHEAGRPNAVSSMGVSLGTAAGLPLITYLVYRFDWHTSFLALAALNAVVGLPLIALFVRGRGVAAAERPGFGATLKGALRMPRLAPILVIEIATLAYLWGSSAWLPSYLLQERHFSLGAMGAVSSLPFLMSLVSGFLGGLLLDRLPRRLLALPFVVGSAGTAASVLVVAAAHSDVTVAVGLILAGGFWGLQGPAIPTLVQHCAPARSVGSAYGVVNGVGNLVSAFMPTLMGVAIAASGGHGFGAGFALLAGAQAMTLVCGAWLLLRPVQSSSVPESSMDRSNLESSRAS